MEKMEPIKDPKLLRKYLDYLKGKDNSGKYYVLVFVGFNVALRIGDLLKLKYEDFFTSEGKFREHITVREEKTNKERKIKINPETKEVIREYVDSQELEEGDYLFPAKYNPENHLKRGIAWKTLSETARDVGIEYFGTHSLRKTFGYLYYQKTKDIATLMTIFNHSNMKTTMRYIGMDQTQVDNAYISVGNLLPKKGE